MAHLPRWVEHPRLDSSAMLSAYLEWTKDATLTELADTVPHLWLIEHAPAETPAPTINGVSMPQRICATVGCRRCLSLRGGYQFKWTDRRWLAYYERCRRPGSLSFEE